MKLVTAVIKPYQLDAVKEALALGVAGLTVTRSRGTAARRATPRLPGCRVHGGVPAEVRVEVLTDEIDVERVVDAVVTVGPYRQDR